MEIPTTLKHKPVIITDDYDHIDGRYAYDTDVKGLSLGLAQWNDRGNVEISAKIWRHSGNRWSRQSEEIPLHRVLDLAIFIIRAKKYLKESYIYENYYDPEHPEIDRVGLQGDAMTMRFCLENEMLDEDMKLFMRALGEDDELIGERLRVLSGVLNELDY